MSAGGFTCATLAEVQLKADQIWADAASQKDYIANVEALTAVRKEQTVRIAPLETEKDNQVKLIWVKDCGETTAACSDECTAGGDELEAACDTHELDLCRTIGFTVKEKALRSTVLTKEELVAKGFLKKMKVLDEYLATTLVAELDTMKGVNAYTSGKGTVSGFETAVGPAYWNASLFAYFNLVAKKNKFTNPYLLSGTNLYEAYLLAQANSGNGEGKGAKSLFDSFRTYFDVFNIDSQLSPDQSTFLIDANAVAFVNKAYYNWSAGDARANSWGGVGGSVGMKYAVESKNLPGVFYDVTYKVSCSSNEIEHDFSLQYKAGIFRNPVGCNLNNTGILKFNCE